MESPILRATNALAAPVALEIPRLSCSSVIAYGLRKTNRSQPAQCSELNRSEDGRRQARNRAQSNDSRFFIEPNHLRRVRRSLAGIPRPDTRVARSANAAGNGTGGDHD